jgi:hypothetical protein
MRGDFTRSTFRPSNHYRSVRLQQGRVQLDADWNEQADIDAHVEETTTLDLVGSCGGPHDDAGFSIVCEGAEIPASGCPGDQLQIGHGRYYVDGVLCENDEDVYFGKQPDLPGVSLPTEQDEQGTYLAYLDVWQEHLTALERPDLREVALGGPDTATRAKTLWQVKLELLTESEDSVACSDFEGDWVPAGAESAGRLAAKAVSSSAELASACLPPPGAGYRRLENQLYRVEIHDGSDAELGPTFKWSRDNGTVVARMESIDADSLLITISEPGKDAVLGFAAGQWVELSDEERTLRGEPGILVELASAQGTELTVKVWPDPIPSMDEFGAVPTVRRWDSLGALTLTRGAWLDLEDGAQIQFEGTLPGEEDQTYRTGDYWLIQARTAKLTDDTLNLIGGIDWPQENGQPSFEGRHGIQHHYCPIAVLRLAVAEPDGESEDDQGGQVWTLVSDCRRIFPPVTQLATFFYVGGDGQEAMPNHDVPQPLQVGVSNGRWPVEGARVRFSTQDPDGRLASTKGALPGTTNSIDSITQADGIASCSWRLDPSVSDSSQQVVAILLDDHDGQVGLQIIFTANLSIAAEVFYDAGSCVNLSGVETVQEALDRLSVSASLSYLAGDGQDCMPGQPLAKELKVLVAGSCGPVSGATVQFTAEGNGLVAATEAELSGAGQQFDFSPTTEDGVASCRWQPGADLSMSTQQLEAKLVLPAGVSVHEPTTVYFTANLSHAGLVTYDTGDCANLRGAATVQDAIDLLCHNDALYYVSGDGQLGPPETELGHTLQVRVANGQWPVANATVVFTLEEGSGNLIGGADDGTLEASTNIEGVAECRWILGKLTDPNGAKQRVKASLENFSPVFFNAELIKASDVSYDATNCGNLPNATTVQEAIDALCVLAGEVGKESERIRVLGVGLGIGKQFSNDLDILCDDLTEGIFITCDRSIDVLSIEGKPTCLLTVDVPYPLTATDREFWRDLPFIGSQLISLSSEVSLQDDDTTVLWKPGENVVAWLNMLMDQIQQRSLDKMSDVRVLARLTLKGNFIWASDATSVFLDGDSFGTLASDRSDRTDLLVDDDRYISGNGQRGGDFEMWFYLTSGLLGRRRSRPRRVTSSKRATPAKPKPVTSAKPKRVTSSTPRRRR